MLSIPHLIIVFIVALVVFGPEKLPELARNIGKVLAEFKRASGDFRSTFEDHLRELEREADTRRIAGPTPSATTSSEDAVAPQEPGTVAAKPPYLYSDPTAEPSVEASGEQAPWEKAVETAAAAAEISADPPEASVHAEEQHSQEDLAGKSEHNSETMVDGNFTT